MRTMAAADAREVAEIRADLDRIAREDRRTRRKRPVPRGYEVPARNFHYSTVALLLRLLDEGVRA